MAQTVAIQRGSGTVTIDGSSKLTLFTQSSGTATRVIVGGIFVSFPNTYSGTVYAVSINVNGSGNYIPVILRKHSDAGSCRTLNTFPNSESAIGTSFTGSPNVSGSSSWGLSYTCDNPSGFAGQVASAQAAIYGANLYGPYIPLNISPGQFWMANGDSLVINAYNSYGAGSATVVWHFVTITES